MGTHRLFSPWQYNIDAAATRLLENTDWNAPEATALPTGTELVERYLQPLAATQALSDRIRTGTWENLNPLGQAGLEAPGEAEAREAGFITTPLPDVTRRERAWFAGRHVLVVGAGHSAANTLVESGTIKVHTSFTITGFTRNGNQLTVHAETPTGQRTLNVDALVPATGFRPELHMLSELGLDLDPAVEAPQQLGPLIDPEFHSYGSVEAGTRKN